MDVPRVTLAQVEDAAARIRGSVYRTPLLPSSRFDTGSILLKLEALQPTGSFKVRGAWNRMSRSDEAERKKGFVTVSAGNHGQAVAWSAKRLGAPCTVYVPTDAVQRKVDSMESMGAKIVRRPHQEIMEAMTDDRMARLGMAFVHPFGDPLVVAGQGTVGLEIVEDLPEVKSIVVPIGGGGLASGVAQAVRAKSRGVKVYGVQAEGAAPVPKSLASGRAEDVGAPHTIADGIGATKAYDYMLPLLKEHLEAAFTVSDDDIRGAMKRILMESHVAPEPAGAASLACALKYAERIPKPAVCIVSGGNADPALLASLLA
jgi:threonine dehydratase